MIIETGDYFVVTRGFRMGSMVPVFSMFGSTEERDDEPKYARDHEGLVFRALEVCDTAVACEVVFATGYKKDRIGNRESLNLREIEVMVVTPKYVELLTSEATQ